MAGKLRLRDTVFAYLKNHAGEKFTARQIAEWIFATYPEECDEKRRNSTQNLDDNEAFVQQLCSEIGAHRLGTQKKYPQIKITEERPRKYYYSTQTADAEVEQAEAGQKTVGDKHSVASPSARLDEHDLYPLLVRYLLDEHGVFSMRIDEKKSSNRRGTNGNHWLHPDVVGMENLSAEWSREVRECVSAYSDRRARLWSFEVKLLLNRSNVRECFFQTLSNSSWANFAYLVAQNIEGGETMKELRMLSAAHGIGLMRLDVENPPESEVLIPACERSAVDWDMVNRLAEENSDFREFVKRIRRFHQTGDTADWGLRMAAD